MKTITFNSNFGRFDYAISCEIGDEVNASTEKLAMQGLANVGFRAVASEVEKALVKGGHSTKEAKRSDILFSDEAAMAIEIAAQGKLDKLSTEEGLPKLEFSVRGEHVFGESEQARKLATALLAKVEAMEEGQRMGMMMALGIEEDDTEDAKIEKCHKFLATLKAPKKATPVKIGTSTISGNLADRLGVSEE